MVYCIPKDLIEKIQSLNLKEMDSLGRTKTLSEILGSENGKEINNLFEKRLTLKNQDVAMNRFIEDLSGVTAEKKAKLKENITKRLADKQKVIEEQELLTIVQETLEKKYDLDIPDEDVSKLFKIKKEADVLKTKAIGTLDRSAEKMAWGQKLNEFDDVLAKVGGEDISLWQTMKQSLQESKIRIQQSGGIMGKTGQTLKEVMNDILGFPTKGVKAAWDASYIFRQGLKVLTADPKTWGSRTKSSLASWTRVYDKAYMKELFDAFKADIRTRDLYQDAVDAGLALGVKEDQFPTNVAEKIPYIGNLFKASDDSFTMFSQGSRMDLFEKYVNLHIAKTGEKPSKELMTSLASISNHLSGRASLGKAEAINKGLNDFFFSARWQWSNIKYMTDIFSKDPFVQKVAATNLARNIAFIGGTMLTLSAITDVGFDPRNTTFGKVRIPGSKKWVDVTGGLASYFSLGGKMYDAMSKKPVYGKDTAMDIFINFLKGKLAPVPGAVRDVLEQRDFSGKKPTPVSVLRSLFAPISADNITQDIIEQEKLNVAALSALFDILGSGVSEPKSKSEGSYWSPFK